MRAITPFPSSIGLTVLWGSSLLLGMIIYALLSDNVWARAIVVVLASVGIVECIRGIVRIHRRDTR